MTTLQSIEERFEKEIANISSKRHATLDEIKNFYRTQITKILEERY